jgi:hypothetical protein
MPLLEVFFRQSGYNYVIINEQGSVLKEEYQKCMHIFADDSKGIVGLFIGELELK